MRESVSNKNGTSLLASLGEPFNSLDPIEYDWLVNHPVQSILHAKLVSTYSPLGVRPQLAESWESTASNTRWIFRLRKDLSFADGQPLTPEIVVKSLRRALFLLKKSHSKHALLQNLKGIETFQDLEKDEISGLKWNADSVELNLKAPMPKLLEMLSFGVWGIVHPKNYDGKTGKWIADHQEVLGLGPYEFKGMQGIDAHFERKRSYPNDLMAKRSFPKIVFLGTVEVTPEADLVEMSSDNEALIATHKFFGPRAMHIFYAQVLGAKDKGRPLSNHRGRSAFRDRYLKNLEASGIKVVRSFFPLALGGVSEAIPHESSSDKMPVIFQGKKIRTLKVRPGSVARFAKSVEGIGQTASELGASHKSEDIDPTKMFPGKIFGTFDSPPWDISIRGTGIAVDELETDVRLMFSPEGINLPDPTGKIHKLLLETPLNLDAINKQLWEDALIWPITHFSRGIWANDRVDFSEYNTLLPMGELQWVNQK